MLAQTLRALGTKVCSPHCAMAADAVALANLTPQQVVDLQLKGLSGQQKYDKLWRLRKKYTTSAPFYRISGTTAVDFEADSRTQKSFNSEIEWFAHECLQSRRPARCSATEDETEQKVLPDQKPLLEAIRASNQRGFDNLHIETEEIKDMIAELKEKKSKEKPKYEIARYVPSAQGDYVRNDKGFFLERKDGCPRERFVLLEQYTRNTDGGAWIKPVHADDGQFLAPDPSLTNPSLIGTKVTEREGKKKKGEITADRHRKDHQPVDGSEEELVKVTWEGNERPSAAIAVSTLILQSDEGGQSADVAPAQAEGAAPPQAQEPPPANLPHQESPLMKKRVEEKKARKKGEAKRRGRVISVSRKKGADADAAEEDVAMVKVRWQDDSVSPRPVPFKNLTDVTEEDDSAEDGDSPHDEEEAAASQLEEDDEEEPPAKPDKKRAASEEDDEDANAAGVASETKRQKVQHNASSASGSSGDGRSLAAPKAQKPAAAAVQKRPQGAEKMNASDSSENGRSSKVPKQAASEPASLQQRPATHSLDVVVSSVGLRVTAAQPFVLWAKPAQKVSRVVKAWKEFTVANMKKHGHAEEIPRLENLDFEVVFDDDDAIQFSTTSSSTTTLADLVVCLTEVEDKTIRLTVRPSAVKLTPRSDRL